MRIQAMKLDEKGGTYSKRVWLNKGDSPSTGSVVAYHGPMKWSKGQEEMAAFLEVADCHDKVRLHCTPSDTMGEFVQKMELLRDTIDQFINHLKEA
jgi:hypothetical protein